MPFPWDEFPDKASTWEACKREYATLTARLQASERDNAVLKQCVDDTAHEMECLPGCDSYAHEEMCPVTNTAVAWRTLVARLQVAEAELEDTREARRILAANFANRGEEETQPLSAIARTAFNSHKAWFQASEKATADFKRAARERDDALRRLERTKERLMKFRYSRPDCHFCGQSPHSRDCVLIPMLDDINAALEPYAR